MTKFLATNKGRRELIHKGFRYQLERSTLLKDIYKCVNYYKTKCYGRAHVSGEEVLVTIDHNHAPDAQSVSVRETLTDLKARAVTSQETPSLVVANVIANRTQVAKAGLPKEKHLKKTVRRTPKKHNILPTTPSSLKDLIIPESFQKLNDGRKFLFFDSGQETERILIFSTERNLDLLERATVWHIDGTFSAAPLLFSQLFTIHSVNGNCTFPAIFVLLPDKTQVTYQRMITAVKSFRSNLAPPKITSDFEKAVLNVFREAFSSSVQSGCFFHFRQSIWRKVQQLGLTERYSTDETFAHSIKMLSALSFLPLSDVLLGYDYLLEQEVFKESTLDPLLTYFESTWIGVLQRGGQRRDPLFEISLWNQNDNVKNGISKTNNIVESFHNTFNQLLGCSHPTLWKLILDLQKQQNLNDLRIEQLIRGDQQLKKRNNSIARLEYLVLNYTRDNLPNFLRGVANNFSL